MTEPSFQIVGMIGHYAEIRLFSTAYQAYMWDQFTLVTIKTFMHLILKFLYSHYNVLYVSLESYRCTDFFYKLLDLECEVLKMQIQSIRSLSTKMQIFLVLK